MVVHVTVASPDGTYTHPFAPNTPVGTIRHNAYVAIRPANIPESQTFLLFANARIENESRPVSDFATETKHKSEASFTLAWHNPAGTLR